LKCPKCGWGMEYFEEKKKNDYIYNMFQCENCGLRHCGNVKNTNEFYLTKKELRKYDGYNESQTDKKMELINKHFPHMENKEVLEIGSATGNVLNRFYAGVGVEPSPSFAQYCKSKYGLLVHNKRFEDVELKQKFDLIVCYQTFYYFTDPIKMLKKIKRLLKPEGIFIMSAIDLSGKYNNRILPFYYRLPDYDRLLVKCGFNIKEIILNTEVRFNKNLVNVLPEFIKKMFRPFIYESSTNTKPNNIILVAAGK